MNKPSVLRRNTESLDDVRYDVWQYWGQGDQRNVQRQEIVYGKRRGATAGLPGLPSIVCECDEEHCWASQPVAPRGSNASNFRRVTVKRRGDLATRVGR